MAGKFDIPIDEDSPKSKPEREPTEQECKDAIQQAYAFIRPKLSISGKLPIMFMGETIGYFPRDIQKALMEGEPTKEAIVQACKYADEVIQDARDKADPKKERKWQAWINKFRVMFKKKSQDDDEYAPQWDNPKHLHIPGSYAVDYNDVAHKLFGAVADSYRYFIRGKQMVTVGESGAFDIINDNALRSIPSEFFEKILAVNTKKNEVTKQVELVTKKANLSRDLCAALLENAWLDLLPRIHTISSCPVIYESSAKHPSIHRKGYLDHDGGVFVTGGESDEVELNAAVHIIEDVLCDFQFSTKADGARAIAMIITPALVQGGFIEDRVPGDFAESDESQSGKGYRHDLTVAIYNDAASLVTQRLGGGTGSFDEFLGDALLKGRTFIRLDNLRGKLDSPSLESFFTTPFGSDFLARGFGKSGYVQAGRNILQASSNGLQGTRDISNRMCIVRIRKQSAGYKFKAYPEGDVLEHIRTNQGKFLGAVHTIIAEWIRQGRQRTGETRHDFRKWAQILDWILTNIFQRPGMLDGHREIQNRVSTPIISVLRELAIEADRMNRLGEAMIASELVSFAAECGANIADIKGHDDDQKARWMGIQLGAAFKQSSSETLQIDEYRCVRIIDRARRTDGNGYKDLKYYRFERSGA